MCYSSNALFLKYNTFIFFAVIGSLSPINLWELIELCKQRQINLTDKVKQVVSSIQ